MSSSKICDGRFLHNLLIYLQWCSGGGGEDVLVDTNLTYHKRQIWAPIPGLKFDDSAETNYYTGLIPTVILTTVISNPNL